MSIRTEYRTVRGIAAAAALLAGAIASAEPGGASAARVVVDLQHPAQLGRIVKAYEAVVVDAIEEDATYLLEFPGRADDDLPVEDLLASEGVDWIEVDHPLEIVGGSTGSFFVQVDPSLFTLEQRGLAPIEPASSETTGRSIRVAVIDGGLDLDHPGLAGRILDSGYDYIDMDSIPAADGNGHDDDGDGEIDELMDHGTYVAGLISLIAPEADILPIRILNDEGHGFTFRAAQAIRRAVAEEADVICLSFGLTQDVHVIGNALQKARDDGIIVIAAAGNYGATDPVVFPAADARTIAIAATDQNDVLCPLSSYGPHVDLCAPGFQIVSMSSGGRYARASGTSASAAVTAGAVAMLMQQHPQFTGSDAALLLSLTADEITEANAALAGMIGEGRINLAHALAIQSAPSSPR